MVSKASELLGSTFPVLLTRPHGHMGLPGSDSGPSKLVEQLIAPAVRHIYMAYFSLLKITTIEKIVGILDLESWMSWLHGQCALIHGPRMPSKV